jgi:transposase
MSATSAATGHGDGISFRKERIVLQRLLAPEDQSPCLLCLKNSGKIPESCLATIVFPGLVAEQFPVTHEKAVTLQKRIVKHQHEWLVFLDDPRVPPTNNMAERALRPLVVLRKITFGHRSHAGAERMGRLMTVAETAKRHGHRPSDIYYRLFTQSPGRVLRQLYDDS